MELSTTTIVNSTVENIEVPDKKDLKAWFENFKELSIYDQQKVVTELNKSQSIYIRDHMANMKNPIPLYILGKFYYKESRKEFYDIRKENPDMSLEEVINLVKERYWERYKKRKRFKKSKNIRVKL